MYVLYIGGSGSLVYLCWFFTSFWCVYTPVINWACGRWSLTYNNGREDMDHKELVNDKLAIELIVYQVAMLRARTTRQQAPQLHRRATFVPLILSFF